MNENHQWTLQELADCGSCTVYGDPEFTIARLSPLDAVGAHELCYLEGEPQKVSLPEDAVVLLREQDLNDSVKHALVCDNPKLAFAKIAALFAYKPLREPGIHKSAVVASSAHIDKTAVIGAHVVIGERVLIGKHSVIEAGCILADDVSIGEQTICHPRVCLYAQTRIGDRVVLHSGAVIGSDGFGNALDQEQHWHSIPQLGRVCIGNDVSVGANTTIDCGALDDTVIEEGVRLDNQIQIAHNVRIGAHTAVAGCVGIAGSTQIGRHCLIGGGCCIAGHIHIANGVILTGMSMVTGSITEAGVYSSGTGLQPNRQWHKSAVRFRQLDDIAKRLKKLERTYEHSDR
jgi:UDP-3-O-[3-hydroxymyristoyl] glucosamine N-acyltransferase